MVDLALHVILHKHLHGEASVFRGVYVLQDLAQSHHVQQRCRISHGLVVVHVLLHNIGTFILVVCYLLLIKRLTEAYLIVAQVELQPVDIIHIMNILGGNSISDEESS